ncbi:MAG TPA: thioredoxin domain-containing protein, partial [Burkholderiales bacterium]|nr:thioredoxin domain-containing protein [Burkholderiales bacterium]
KDDRTLGNANAPIKMLEYAAPTCPHCAHFAMTVMPLIKQQYIDTGKVFYIFRTFPLSAADGAVEAIARVCLPADKYFEFLDLMFRNQPKWDPDGYQVPDVGAAIKQMARVKGVSPEQADRCMTDKNEQERINQVAQDAVNRYNIQGTPTFVINGTVVQAGEASWPELKKRLDTMLSKK